MSSEKESSAKTDMLWVFALVIVVVSIKYGDAIAHALKALLIVLMSVGVLGGFGYWAYVVYTRPKTAVHSEKGTELDLSKFGMPEWDAELEYERDRLTGEWVEVPELKVQSALARQEKPAEPIPAPSLSKKEEDLLESPLHLAGNLTQNQITKLEHSGYLLKEFVPLGKTRREWYYILEQKPESFEHTFVVYSIVRKLKPLVQSVEVHRTQQPDIVFYFKGERYALEVETPHRLPHKHARLSRKAQCLTREFGVRSWFVITRSAYAKTFARYGEVLTRNQIDQWIKDTFTTLPQPPSPYTI